MNATLTRGHHDAAAIERAQSIDRELDDQGDCAYLTTHDVIERELIYQSMKDNRATVDRLNKQYERLREWWTRDEKDENPRHEQINARARERARRLEMREAPVQEH